MLFLMESEEELRNVLTKVQSRCLRFIYKVGFRGRHPSDISRDLQVRL